MTSENTPVYEQLITRLMEIQEQGGSENEAESLMLSLQAMELISLENTWNSPAVPHVLDPGEQ